MTHLNVSEIASPADLGLAVYEKVQELTRGKARRAATILSTITCLELDGHDLPASPWCTLVLFSLYDLAIHAPGITLKICDWANHYNMMAHSSGEASAQEMAAALVWAGRLRRNVELESTNMASMRSSLRAEAA